VAAHAFAGGSPGRRIGKEVLHHMSARNRRAAAAAAIGVFAGAPVGAAGAAQNYGPSPLPAPAGSDHGDPGNATDLIPASRQSVDPPPGTGAGGANGSSPQNAPTDGTAPPPASGDQSTSTQCGPVEFTNMLPTVITCGPVTINITFTTVTTTTTTTTVAAPITAANGAITTGATTAPGAAVRRKQARSTKAKTTRRKRRRPVAGAVRKPVNGRRIVRVRVRLGPRPSR
jgi:hypothetical protein